MKFAGQEDDQTKPAKTAKQMAEERRQAEERARQLEAFGAWIAAARSEAGELILGGDRQAFLVEQLSRRVHRLGYEARLIADADRVRRNLLHYARQDAEVQQRAANNADLLPACAWDCLRQGRLDYVLTRGAQAGYLRPYPVELHAYFSRPLRRPEARDNGAGMSQREAEDAMLAPGRGF